MSQPLLPLSYKYRLHCRRDYLRFFDNSQVFRLRSCFIYKIPNSLSHSRLGITLKASGTSVDRNAVKRRIREAFRIYSLSNYPGFDYNVVIPKGKSLSFPFSHDLYQCIKDHFSDVS